MLYFGLCSILLMRLGSIGTSSVSQSLTFRSNNLPNAYTLNDVGVYLRTYRSDSQLASAAVLSLLVNLPEAEISVICPPEDVDIVTESITARVGKDSRVRVLPVGMGHKWYADRAENWSSRESLMYDAIHADLYVNRSLVFYTESDVLLMRRVELDDLINQDSGLPYVFRIDLGHLCRYMMLTMGMEGVNVCNIHATTARDAGTLFGVFNEFDFERIPLWYQRNMLDGMRRRVGLVHGHDTNMDDDGVLQNVFNYFARHHGGNVCHNGLLYIPPQLSWGQALYDLTDIHIKDTMVQFSNIPTNMSRTCLIGPSKPHTLGTYAHYFAGNLHHQLDVNYPGKVHRRRLALQLLSHRTRHPDGRLSENLEAFLTRMFILKDPLLTELGIHLVNVTAFEVKMTD